MLIPEVAFEVIDGAEDDDEAPEPHTVDDATGTAGAASGTKGGDTESATANDSTNDAANDIANDVTQATLSMHSSGLIASLLAAALNRRRGSSSSSLSWLEDTCIYDEAEVRSALPSAAPAYPSAASSAGVDGFLLVLAVANIGVIKSLIKLTVVTHHENDQYLRKIFSAFSNAIRVPENRIRRD
ncbi:hypothetical protein HDU82_006277 [Entophlyctis luteolus]|nr:hypothetical protein HDU82_006277 [Entophlyctis luteolus]